jgi:hypothetical protein
MSAIVRADAEQEDTFAVAALTELSLLKHEPFEDGAPAVIVHRLVQAVSRQRSKATGTARAAMERLSELLSIRPPRTARGIGKLRELGIQLRFFAHTRSLMGYEMAFFSGEYARLADRYIQMADRCAQAADARDAAGDTTQGAELRARVEPMRQKATQYREASERIAKIRM